MKHFSLLLLFLSQMTLMAQTNDELLAIQNKFHDYDEVQFVYYYSGKYSLTSKTIKKPGAYSLYIDYDDVRKIYSSEVIGGLILVKKDGKYGYVNINGKKVISTQYEYASPVYQVNSKGEPIIIVKKNGKMGIINSKNKVVLDFEYSEISRCQSNRSFCVKDDKYFFIDQNLNRINDINYDKVYSFKPGGTAHVVLNGKSGLIDTTGKTILPTEYDNFYSLEENYFDFYKIEKDNKFGIVDRTGKITLPLDYESIELVKCEKGLYDSRHYNPFDFEYKDFQAFLKLGYLSASKNGQYLLITGKGEIIDSNGYKNITFIGNESLRGVDGKEKFGTINYKGQVLIPFEYDSISYFCFKRVLVKKNSKYGYLNEDGSECTAPVFYYAENFSGFDKAYFEYKNKTGDIEEGYIDKSCLIHFGGVINRQGSYVRNDFETYDDTPSSNTSNQNVSNKTNNQTSNSGNSSTSNNKTEDYSGQVYFHFDSNNKSKGERLYIHYGSNGSSKTSTGVGSDASIKCEVGKVYYSFTGEKKDMVLITEIKPSDCKKKFYSKDFVK